MGKMANNDNGQLDVTGYSNTNVNGRLWFQLLPFARKLTRKPNLNDPVVQG